MVPAALDRWIDAPVLRTRHRREAAAGREALWASAATIRLGDCRLLGRLIRARIPGVPADLTFDELFHGDPFSVLEEGRTHLVSALCGRIWTVRRDFTVLEDPAQFHAWRVPGTVRVLFATWAEPAGSGSALVSEVRIAAVDRRAELCVRGLGPFIAAFQGLVALEPLTLAAQRAERR